MRRPALAAVLAVAGLCLAGCKTQQEPAQTGQAQPKTGESLTSLQGKLQAANARYNAACYPQSHAESATVQKPFRSDEPACKQAQTNYIAAMRNFNAAKAEAGAL